MPKCANGEVELSVIKRTYIDANLLIAAWHGKDDAGFKALEILDDPARRLVVSDALW
jgi:hypothetical protein